MRAHTSDSVVIMKAATYTSHTQYEGTADDNGVNDEELKKLLIKRQLRSEDNIVSWYVLSRPVTS